MSMLDVVMPCRQLGPTIDLNRVPSPDSRQWDDIELGIMKPIPPSGGVGVCLLAIASLVAPVLAIPFNDGIAFATDLGSSPYLFRQADPRVATFEPFEDSLGFANWLFPLQSRTGSLWFKWTAPEAGTYHLLEVGFGDIVDIYRVVEGQPGPFVPEREDGSSLAFTAAGGEEFFIRHTAENGEGGSSTWAPRDPVGFLLRKEGTGHITDFGDRSCLAGFLTSAGASNSEKYRWTVPGSGDYQIQLTFWGFVDPTPGLGVTLRRNGIVIPEFELNQLSTYSFTAEDQVEMTLSGDVGFAQLYFAPAPPVSSDLGSAGAAVLPATHDGDYEWLWTAPSDGVLKLDLSSVSPLVSLYLADYSAFEVKFVEMGYLDKDSLTLESRTNLVQRVEEGTTYGFAASLGPFDPGLSPASCISLSFFESPTTVDERIDAAVASLEMETQAGLVDADNQLAAVLAVEPTHPQANILRAVNRLILLESDPAYSAFLQSLNISGAGSGVFDVEYTPTTNEGGQPLFPEGATATDRVAALRQLVSPRLAEIRGYLTSALAAGDRRTHLTRLGGSFVIDQADILALKASVDIVGALLDLLAIHDLGGSLNAIVEFEEAGEIDLETALDQLPSLLQLANAAAVTEFKEKIANANTLLGAALIESSGGRVISGNHFFPPVGDPVEGRDLLGFLIGLDDVAKALAGPIEIEGVTLDLSQWNASTASLRSLLPMLRGNKALGFTAPDPELDGILPGMDAGGFNHQLESHRMLADPAGFAFWIQGFLEEGLPVGLSRFFDDADGDGDSNGEEYYFASDPNDPSVRVQSPVAALDQSSGGTRFRVSFVRRIGAADIRYVAAVSNDIKVWDYSGGKVSVAGPPVPVGDGIGEIVTVEIDADLSNRQFIRIHAVAE